MMRRKNGFTLIEILVTITIMALLFGIGVPTYLMVSKNLKQRSYDNKVSYALAKAESWANDTGRDVTNIAHLIEEGYMEADNENGAYDSPIDNSSMLCYTIRINYDDNQYSSYLTGEEYCDYAELEKQTSIVEIVKMDDTTNNVLSDEDWTRNNVLLRVQFKDEESRNKYQNSVVEIEWNGNNNRDTVAIHNDFSTKNQKAVQAAQFMDTRYEATVKIVHENKTYIYKAYSQVKIDRQSPMIYQDDILVDHFDDWSSREKGVHLISTDYDGSGVYGYYIMDTLTICSTNKNAYSAMSSEEFDLSLKQGEYYACVMDKVGNVSSAAKVTVIKTDDVPPTLGDFEISEAQKGHSYYNKLSLRVQVIDDASGANAIRYCVSTSDCTPNNTGKVDANGYISIPFTTANKNAQKICAIGIDYAGNESAKKCSDGYFFDNTEPVNATLNVTKENHRFVAHFGGNDAESGMYQYKVYLGTSESNMSEIATTTTSNLTGILNLDNLIANSHYFVKLTATNEAGLSTEVKSHFTANLTMHDAEYYCDTSSGYCNKGIYVKYSGRLFALYRGTIHSTFAVNIDQPVKTTLIVGGCCDQGHCQIQSVYNEGYSGLYNPTSALGTAYRSLNKPTNYLNQETYSFGESSTNLSNPTYKEVHRMSAYYGLLDLNEYRSIAGKSYMNGVSTLLSTVYPNCFKEGSEESWHYVCNYGKAHIMGLYGDRGNITPISAVVGKFGDLSRNGAMTLPFKHENILTSGTGTRENPYTIE